MLSSTQITHLKSRLHSRGDFALTKIFKALGDPVRLGILKLFMKRRDLCVTDIANIFNISVPAASHQLKILELVGLVERKRMGQMICYEIKNHSPIVKSVIRILKN